MPSAPSQRARAGAGPKTTWPAGDHRGADAANNTWVEELLAIGLNEMKSKGGNAAFAKRDRQSGVRACVKRKTLSNKIPSIIFYTQSKLLAWREGRNWLW